MALSSKIKTFSEIAEISPAWPLFLAGRFDDFAYHSAGLTRRSWNRIAAAIRKGTGLFLGRGKDPKTGELYWIIPAKNGLRFAVRPGENEWHSMFEILREPERHRMSYLKHYKLKKDDIVVDIGANIGVFSVRAAKAGARVFTYEPIVGTFNVAAYNLAINKCDKAVAHQQGVAATHGSQTFYFGKVGSTVASMFPEENAKSESFKVDTVTIADVFTDNGIDHIDFLKMDCEGGEYGVCREEFAPYIKKIRNIAMEYHSGSEEIIVFLKKLGFTIQEEKEPLAPGRGMIWAWT